MLAALSFPGRRSCRSLGHASFFPRRRVRRRRARGVPRLLLEQRRARYAHGRCPRGSAAVCARGCRACARCTTCRADGPSAGGGAGRPLMYSVDYTAAPAEIGCDARKIRRNKFLEEIYLDFYERILVEIPPQQFPKALEVGSGGGFLKELAPHVMTSECVAAPGIERVVDACNIGDSFADGALDAICALNVFHHLPNASGFLGGPSRGLRPGGRVVLGE